MLLNNIALRNLSSLQEEAFDIGNDPSIDMSIPVDLCDYWSEDIYGNEEVYQSPEYGISHSHFPELSRSVFQCAVEDHRTSIQDTEDNTSDPGIDNDIVIFDPDAEPDTPNEYKYHLKNPILQALDEAQKLNYARRLDDLGNNNFQLAPWPMLI